MAQFLRLSEHEFIQTFTRLNQQRTGLALADQDDGSCIFLADGDCSINSVKPQQCRDFPNLWNFPGFEKLCRAKPMNMSLEQYQAAILKATGRDEFNVNRHPPRTGGAQNWAGRTQAATAAAPPAGFNTLAKTAASSDSR
jgi:hypothetical protein